MTTGGEHEKFDALEDEWWTPRGKLYALHMINPVRFSYFSEKAGDLKGKKVLDIGCGGGLLSESFAACGAVVTGIDLSKPAIEAALRHAGRSDLEIDYRVISVSELLEEKGEGSFDIVVASEVLEHVEDLPAFLTDAAALLKTGGLFFFSTFNRTMKARLLGICVAEYILKMVPRGAHEYKKFIRPSTLVELLARNGIKVKDLRGMTFDPLKLAFKLSGDLSVNYLGYGVKEG